MYDNQSPTALDLRYTPGSDALLAPSHYKGTINAWISFSSIDVVPEVRIAYKKVQQALEARRGDLSFTYHWGKHIPRNEQWPVESFGRDVIREWKLERQKLLPSSEDMRLFSNDFTDKLGLT